MADLRKKKTAGAPPKKQKKPRRAALKNNPLPPPVDLGGPNVPQHQASDNQSDLFGLGSLFKNPQPGRNPSLTEPLRGSIQNDGPLSAEAERILAGVPDRVGDPDDVAGAAPDAGGAPSAEIVAPMLTADMLAGAFHFGFAWVSARLKTECFVLDEPAAMKLGQAWLEPADEIARRIMPDLMLKWGMANPKLFAACITSIGVVMPMVQAYSLERAQKKAPPERAKEPTAHHGTASRPVASGADGVVWAAQ